MSSSYRRCEDLQTGAMETSKFSAQTNSRLPISCSEVNNSASASYPRSHTYMASDSCSPWQSGLGHNVPRSDCRKNGQTAAKLAVEPASIIDLRSDPGAVHNARSSEPQFMPHCVDYSGISSSAENFISLRADSCGADQNVNESRLSCDGIDDTTVVDASSDPNQTSVQSGYLAALHWIS